MSYGQFKNDLGIHKDSIKDREAAISIADSSAQKFNDERNKWGEDVTSYLHPDYYKARNAIGNANYRYQHSLE